MTTLTMQTHKKRHSVLLLNASLLLHVPCLPPANPERVTLLSFPPTLVYLNLNLCETVNVFLQWGVHGSCHGGTRVSSGTLRHCGKK